MGIRFACPNGHKLNVKEQLAGKRGVCPSCGAKFVIPAGSEANGGTVTTPTPGVGDAKAGIRIVDARPSEDASTSIVISTVEPAGPPAQSPGVVDPPTIIPPPAPTAFDFATTPATPAPTPASNYAIRRALSRRRQMRIAVFLFLAAIVLAIVLAWVLRRGAAEATSARRTTTRLARSVEQAYVAEAVTIFLKPRDDRVASL